MHFKKSQSQKNPSCGSEESEVFFVFSNGIVLLKTEFFRNAEKGEEIKTDTIIVYT